jgi:uncharacterized protein DUF4919
MSKGAGPWRQGLLALFLAASFTSPSFADDAATTYANLVRAAKAGNQTVDWQAMRFAYADSPDFDVFGTKTADQHKQMFTAFQAGDYRKALGLAAAILDQDYVDIDAQAVSDIADQKLGDSAAAKPHHDAVIGLLRSIMTGDGLTEATAFSVISVTEEYGVLRIAGWRSTGQSLVRGEGHVYDKLGVTESNGQSRDVYFLIDRVMAAESAATKRP